MLLNIIFLFMEFYNHIKAILFFVIHDRYNFKKKVKICSEKRFFKPFLLRKKIYILVLLEETEITMCYGQRWND